MLRLRLLLLVAAVSIGCSSDTTTTPPIQTECSPGQTDTTCQTQCQSTGSRVCDANGIWGLCTPPAETCNQKDDDCDGQTDEDLVNCGGNTTDCPSKEQQCVTTCNNVGKQFCQDGKWGDCIPPAETCNQKDDDCDGQTDEDIQMPCNNACGSGFMVCNNGEMSECSAPKPIPEVCDNKDNDCDGKKDEGDVAGKPLEETCPLGDNTKTCVNGKWKTDPEVCDGIDNNCDGIIDNIAGSGKCECLPNETQSCDNGGLAGIGVCTAGIQTCSAQGKWSACGGDGFVGKSTEKCDNLDNDCNGTVDDLPANATSIPCGSVACGLGTKECQEGKMVCVGGVDEVTDLYEPNPTCPDGEQVNILEEKGLQVIVANVAKESDVDWYKIVVSEKGGLFSQCDQDKPEKFRFELTLDPPEDMDLDLCVFPADENDCGTLPDGNDLCMDLPCVAGEGTCADDGEGIYADGDGLAETYVHNWEGECGSWKPDTKTYYVKVVSYIGGNKCSTYSLSAQLTSWQE